MMGYAYAHRFVDYSATNAETMDRPVLRFIHGINKHRVNAVTLRQIEKYFRATPPEFTRRVVDKMVEKGCVLMLRSGPNRKRMSYLYDLSNQGACNLFQGTYWDTEWGRKLYVSRDA